MVKNTAVRKNSNKPKAQLKLYAKHIFRCLSFKYVFFVADVAYFSYVLLCSARAICFGTRWHSWTVHWLFNPDHPWILWVSLRYDSTGVVQVLLWQTEETSAKTIIAALRLVSVSINDVGHDLFTLHAQFCVCLNDTVNHRFHGTSDLWAH